MVGQALETRGPRGTGPTVRHLRPTDLVGLASFESKAFPNEARTPDRLQRDHRRPPAIATMFEQWVTAEDRQTLVAASGLAIRGLISARNRAGRSAWEIDWLLFDPDADEQTAEALLEVLGAEAARASVHRIFLRLGSESRLLGVAPRAGFVPYCAETLLRCGPVPLAKTTPSLEIRPAQKVDQVGIFRLYHSAVPSQVRSIEGMTLEEWVSTRDVHFWQQREYVWSEEDRIRAWLQLNRGGTCGQFRLLLHPRDAGRLEEVVATAIRFAGSKQSLLVLVPYFQPELRSLLGQVWGFEEAGEFRLLVRQLAVRVPEAQMVPARA